MARPKKLSSLINILQDAENAHALTGSLLRQAAALSQATGHKGPDKQPRKLPKRKYTKRVSTK